MKPEVVGTWWYVANNDGSTWVIKGDNIKLKSSKLGGWTYEGESEVAWLRIKTSKGSQADDRAFVNNPKYQNIKTSWFEGVKFPNIKPMECKEIEITASGNVYIYD